MTRIAGTLLLLFIVSCSSSPAGPEGSDYKVELQFFPNCFLDQGTTITFVIDDFEWRTDTVLYRNSFAINYHSLKMDRGDHRFMVKITPPPGTSVSVRQLKPAISTDALGTVNVNRDIMVAFSC